MSHNIEMMFKLSTTMAKLSISSVQTHATQIEIISLVIILYNQIISETI